jgi:hypothetical protein
MLIQDLFSNNAFACVSDDKCAEELKSALIASFETAVDHGLPPQMALAAVLEWVSEECARLHSGAPSLINPTQLAC